MTTPPTLRDRAIDAAKQAINTLGLWLPDAGREAVVDAVLTLIVPELVASQRRAVRIQQLHDEQRDRIRKVANQTALDSAWGRSTADRILAALEPAEGAVVSSSPYDDLSPRAAWFMENFDVFGLAEICASSEAGQAALTRARALAAEWQETGAQLGAVINMDEAAIALLYAVEGPQETTP